MHSQRWAREQPRSSPTPPPAQQNEISDNVARTISGSLAGALAVAQRYPAQSEQLVSAAREAFLRGQFTAMTLSAALCIASAVLVVLLLPARTARTGKAGLSTSTSRARPEN